MWFFLNDEEKKYAEQARKVAQEIAASATKHHLGPPGANMDNMRAMQKAGFYSLHVPKEYGGLGASYTSWCAVQEEICKTDFGIGNVISHEACGANMIVKMGSRAQQAHYLKKQAAGDFWGLELTEPHGGSDVANFQTRAVRRGDKYVINGKKSWVLNGDVCHRHMIWASTDPEKGNRGLSVFVIEQGAKGVTLGKPYTKTAWTGISTCDVTYENVEVSEDARIGEEGQGFKIFVTGLNQGRLGIAVQSLGLAEGAYEYAKNYASNRKLFGGPVTDKQAVRFKLADMSTAIEAARALVYTTARLMDAGAPETAKMVAMAKYHASDMALKVCNDALFLLGSNGLLMDHPVERMMRDAHGTRIADGTNFIMRHIVANMELTPAKA